VHPTLHDREVDAVERDHLAKGLDDPARPDGVPLRPAGFPAGRGVYQEIRQRLSPLGRSAPGTSGGP
jgi:hypothetical protein